MKPTKPLGIALLVVAILWSSVARAGAPKYVFFFLGDGMSSAQIQAAEAYLTTKNGGSAMVAADLLKEENRLNMSKLPIHGMQTTYDAHALITDSASAATAFACGIKTDSGIVGMDPAKTTGYKSVARLAAEQGKRIGIVSSVSLDHATPAAYYASVPTRSHYNRIATQLVEAGYDFYGGGGFASPDRPARSGDTGNSIWNLLAGKGYTVLNTKESILELKTAPKGKVVCINPWLQDSAAMPYAIDRPETNLSLAEMTEVAVSTLTRTTADGDRSRDRGFFLLVEGGKIDWAAHANDAVAVIGDLLDFDHAVGVALAFSRLHPSETLIVVTGDHETGGMSIGHAATGYVAAYGRLLKQKNSFFFFSQNQWQEHKTAHRPGYDFTAGNNLAANSAMLQLMESAFGLKWAELNPYQQERLEDAYDKSMCGTNNNDSSENDLLYGTHEPIIVTLTRILDELASIGWTSYAHTGVPVPVFAMGSEARRFAGFYDNTDIAKQLARAMDIRQPLPVKK